MDTELHTLASRHYENFPVGSRLIPKRCRRAIHLIYAYARAADDIADEGSAMPAQRIDRLDQWQKNLHLAVKGHAPDDFFSSLASEITNFKLSVRLFDDLLIAFRMDAENRRYESADELFEYCRYSANPIGRLLLEIFESSNETNNSLSDCICTALQLTNFWQDISVDTCRNRLYIPRSEMEQFGVDEAVLQGNEHSAAFRLLMKHQVERTRSLFLEGKPLFNQVAGDFRFELRLIWHGGMRILEKIEAADFDTRTVRPVLTFFDSAVVFFRALKN